MYMYVYFIDLYHVAQHVYLGLLVLRTVTVLYVGAGQTPGRIMRPLVGWFKKLMAASYPAKFGLHRLA